MPNNQNLLAPIANLFRSIWRSCYDVSFYRGVRRAPVVNSIFYFLKLHAIIVLAFFLVLTPAFLAGRTKVEDLINKEVPDNGSIMFRNGRMTTMNLQKPWAPEALKGLLIIDDTATGPATAPGSIVFGATKVFSNGDQEVNATDYAKKITFRLEKKSALVWLASSSSIVFAVVAAALISLAFFLFELISTGLFVIAVSGLMSLVSRWMKLEIPYRQWFAIGLHAVTLPQLISIVFTSFFSVMPMLWFGLFFLIVFSVMSDERLSPIKLED